MEEASPRVTIYIDCPCHSGTFFLIPYSLPAVLSASTRSFIHSITLFITLTMHRNILFSFGLLAVSSAAPAGDSATKSALLASTTSPTYLNPTIATALPMSEPGRKLPPLLPAIHWDHAGSKLEHLAPQLEHALYFSSHGVSDPRLKHAFSHFNATWQNTVVILDHSTLVRSVGCSVGGIAVEFTSNSAYEYAKNSWPEDSDFMLVQSSLLSRVSLHI